MFGIQFHFKPDALIRLIKDNLRIVRHYPRVVRVVNHSFMFIQTQI